MHISRYERIWMYAAGVMIVIFFAVMSVTLWRGLGFVPTTAHVNVPVSTLSDVFEPGVVEVRPGHYEIRMIAHMWAWEPKEVKLPVGAEVTFYVTSGDVMHGFQIQGTNVNVSAMPGQVAKVTHRFDKAGTYHTICNEYCGIGHALMEGKIVIQAAP